MSNVSNQTSPRHQESKILLQEIVSESKDACLQYSPAMSPRQAKQLASPEKELVSVETQSAFIEGKMSPVKSMSTVQTVIAELSISSTPDLK
jgi:hypothetical protein